MFPETIFDYVLEQLAGEVAAREIPVVNALDVDAWIARSAMQKAIRRGMTSLALSAAARLLAGDPRALWRRLLITALEDLGPGEIDTTARIVAAMRDRAFREACGGDWPVVATLVARACEGTRCQAANDLWNVALHGPGLSDFKSSLCEGGLADLLTTMVDEDQEVGRRGVAVLLALGENCGSEAPAHILPDPEAVFEAFAQSGQFGHVAAVYSEAHRLTRVPLAPLTLCLWRASAVQSIVRADDALPEATFIGSTPSFALDQYTRGGKAALRAYVGTSTGWKELAAKAGLARAEHAAAAGELLFRVEGAVVSQRRRWPTGSKLAQLSETAGCFLASEFVHEGKTLIRSELPLMNILRHRALSPLERS